MKDNIVKVLAVADPAVYVYVNEEYGILDRIMGKSGVKVEFDIVPWERYYDTLMDSLNGKIDYDIVMVAGHLWLKDFVEKNYLSELKENDDRDYDYMDISEVIRDEMTIDGIRYLYPSFCDGHIIVYRKSVVEAAYGVIDKRAITTDEYIEIARAVHGYDNMSAVAMKSHESEIFLDLIPFIRNEGIEPIDINSHLPKLDSPECLRGLNKYINLKKYSISGTENLGNDGVKEAFQNKKVVMTTTWGGQLGMVMDENCLERGDIGFLTFNTSWNVTWSFGITAKSKKKDMAEKLLIYLTSKEVDRYVGSFAGSPVRKSTYENDSNEYPWYETHYDLIANYAKPMPKMLNTGSIIGPIYTAVYSAFTGRSEPSEALRKAQSNIMDFINGGV
ncbi:MAG: extracellular solute-binding protein [Maledivibacter sp.]|jgi:multiple sugar transport system substrate-binding protein|nr:extracellular solute-binding protein [Maledivibacter sp.]